MTQPVTRRRGVGAFVLALAPLSITVPAAADVPTEWTFQLQTRSSLDPSIPTFNLPFPSSLSSQSVTLDEDGAVAIRFITAGKATEGIFAGADGVGGPVVTVNMPDTVVYSSDIDLYAGRLAMAFLESGNGAEVRDADDGSLLEVFPAGGSEGVSGFGRVRLTADGAIGYRARSGQNQKHVIDEFVDGERVQTLVATDAPGSPYSFLFSPTINDARQMASKVLLAAGGQAVVRWEPDGEVTTVVLTGAPYNAISNGTDLNDAGDVALFARRASDSVWRLLRANGAGEPAVIASAGDLGIQNSTFANFGPAINDDGLVAFRAKDPFDAVLVGDGEALVRVVGAGDVVETDLGPMTIGFDFGGGVGFQALSGGVAINDAGQVAFSALLENGTIGVFVATPAGAGCPADWNADGSVNSNDLFAFIEDYFTGDADFDASGDTNSDDFFAFLTAFFEGCA